MDGVVGLLLIGVVGSFPLLLGFLRRRGLLPLGKLLGAPLILFPAIVERYSVRARWVSVLLNVVIVEVLGELLEGQGFRPALRAMSPAGAIQKGDGTFSHTGRGTEYVDTRNIRWLVACISDYNSKRQRYWIQGTCPIPCHET